MNINKGIKVCIAAVLLSMFLYPISLKAGPVSMATGGAISGGIAIYSAYKAKDLINKADNIIQEGIAAAQAAGINVVTTISESANIALANFKNIVQNQMTETIGALSKERQAIAYTLIQSMNEVQQQTIYLIGFADMALLSFEKTIDDSLLGVFSRDSIIIQKILGRGQLESDQNDYSDKYWIWRIRYIQRFRTVYRRK